MKSFTYGSDEGHAAFLQAMVLDIQAKGKYPLQLNQGDALMLIEALQMVIETPHTNGDVRDWAEGFYRGVAETVGIELI